MIDFDIDTLSRFAKLDLTAKEKLYFKTELANSLPKLEMLDNIEIKDNVTNKNTVNFCFLRNDNSAEYPDLHSLLGSAKSKKDNYVCVPKVIE